VTHNFQGYFSTTFQDLKLQFPGLSRTKVIFQDFPDPGNFKKKSRTFQYFPGGVGTLVNICASELLLVKNSIHITTDVFQPKLTWNEIFQLHIRLLTACTFVIIRSEKQSEKATLYAALYEHCRKYLHHHHDFPLFVQAAKFAICLSPKNPEICFCAISQSL